MPANQDRVVVITYDAIDDQFLTNPEPVEMPQGTHKLYFALQTVLGANGAQAMIESIESSDPCATATSVGGCRLLSVVSVDNDNPGPDPQSVTYNIELSYDNELRPYDPTVILKPPGPGPR